MNQVVTATPGAFRSVVVTGVARPGQLGDVIARAFALRGDRVCIVARSITDATARASEMRGDQLDAHPFACDLTDPTATTELARQVLDGAGRVDALVNVAGGFALSGPVADSDPAVWSQQIAINLGTAYATTRAFLPALRTTKGNVVFVASSAALPGARVRHAAAYAVAKSGVLTLMRAVAQEEQANDVRSNAVAPGTVRTRDNVAAMPAGTRFVEPESIAAAILFLCSPQALQITGQVIELTP